MSTSLGPANETGAAKTTSGASDPARSVWHRMSGAAIRIRRARQQRRNVVMLVRQLSGPAGVNRSVTNMANGLVAARVDVTVMVLLRHRSIRYELDPRVRVLWVRDMRPQARRQGDVSTRQRALDSQPSRLCEWDKQMSRLDDHLLRRMLSSLGPCTLISQRPPLHEAAALWTPPHVVRLAVERTDFERRTHEVREAIRAIAPRLDRLVLLTEGNRRHWEDFLGSSRQLAVIPNGVPVHRDSSVTSCSAPVVLAAGNLLPNKGFHLLIQAFAPLVEEFPGWQLRIFGEGPEESALQQMIDALGVDHAVRLTGYSPVLGAEMRASSICAISSQSEAFSMVLLEAMDTGLPVVAFDSLGPGEIIQHQQNGLLVENGDVPGMRRSLRTLMRDEQLRRRYGAAGRALAGRYQIEHVIDQWRTLMGSVAR